MPQPGGNLRLTELLASLSLATDLGTGQPLGHELRTRLLAVELAKRMGLDSEHIRSVHQVSLLRFLGCTADSVETAEMAGGGDWNRQSALERIQDLGKGFTQRRVRSQTGGRLPLRRGFR